MHYAHPFKKKTEKEKPAAVVSKKVIPDSPLYSGRLADEVRKQRGDRSLREVAQELRIPHATLQNVEAGHIPNGRLFVKLVAWLGVIDAPTARVLMSYTQ